MHSSAHNQMNPSLREYRISYKTRQRLHNVLKIRLNDDRFAIEKFTDILKDVTSDPDWINHEIRSTRSMFNISSEDMFKHGGVTSIIRSIDSTLQVDFEKVSDDIAHYQYIPISPEDIQNHILG